MLINNFRLLCDIMDVPDNKYHYGSGRMNFSKELNKLARIGFYACVAASFVVGILVIINPGNNGYYSESDITRTCIGIAIICGGCLLSFMIFATVGVLSEIGMETKKKRELLEQILGIEAITKTNVNAIKDSVEKINAKQGQ